MFTQFKKEFFVLALALVLVPYAMLIAPPHQYPSGITVHVADGMSVHALADALHDAGALQSPLTLRVIAKLSGIGRSIQAGTYSLGHPESLLTLLYRLSQGDTGLKPVSVFLPEGATSWEMAALLKWALGSDFDDALYAQLAAEHEGYLFPDTYIFTPGTSPRVVIEAQLRQFKIQTDTLQQLIASSSRPLSDVVIMASIIEREARKPETMQRVSSILWKRIEIDMPLQVDAVFGFIKSTTTYNPSFKDLEIVSPYNTYRNKGLPPGPISNPGIEALRAALTPTPTPYLFYLTGIDGKMYYARTFAEHVSNRRYLR